MSYLLISYFFILALLAASSCGVDFRLRDFLAGANK